MSSSTHDTHKGHSRWKHDAKGHTQRLKQKGRACVSWSADCSFYGPVAYGGQLSCLPRCGYMWKGHRNRTGRTE